MVAPLASVPDPVKLMPMHPSDPPSLRVHSLPLSPCAAAAAAAVVRSSAHPGCFPAAAAAAAAVTAAAVGGAAEVEGPPCPAVMMPLAGLLPV